VADQHGTAGRHARQPAVADEHGTGGPDAGHQVAVPPGSGWPGDPATPDTPVAHNPAEVRSLAASGGSLAELAARESVCRACDRLVRWREEVAASKRRSYQADTYWGRPVPTWGDERASILILGLAPAAHGGNRTGRIFTGDRSGDFLFAALWRCGLAAQPTSTTADDGQELISVRMTAAVRCAPPANKPTPGERDTCAPWLTAELGLLQDCLRVVVCLGHFAWQALWPQLADLGYDLPRPRPAFGHGAEVLVSARPPPPATDAVAADAVAPGRAGADGAAAANAAGAEAATADVDIAGGAVADGVSAGGTGPGEARLAVLGCYHPSQQNTFTGRVTGAMLDAVFSRARQLAGR
jgi:uracil-DNA glycosylase